MMVDMVILETLLYITSIPKDKNAFNEKPEQERLEIQ